MPPDPHSYYLVVFHDAPDVRVSKALGVVNEHRRSRTERASSDPLQQYLLEMAAHFCQRPLHLCPGLCPTIEI